MAVLDELEALLLPRVPCRRRFGGSKIYIMAQFVGGCLLVLVVEFYR